MSINNIHMYTYGPVRSHLHRLNGPATLDNFLLVPWLLWWKKHVWPHLYRLRKPKCSKERWETSPVPQRNLNKAPYRHGFGRLLRIPTWDAKAQQGEVEEASPVPQPNVNSAPYRHGFGRLLRTDLGAKVQQGKVEETSPAHRNDMGSGGFSVPTWDAKARQGKPAPQPNLNSAPYRHGFGKLLRADLRRQSSARKGGGNQPCAPYRHGFGSLLRTDLGCQSAARRGGGGNQPRAAAQFEKHTAPHGFGRLLPTDLGRQSSARWRKPALRTVPTWFRETSPYRLGTPRFSKQRWRKPAAHRTDMVWGGFSVPTWDAKAQQGKVETSPAHRTDMVSGGFSVPTWDAKARQAKVEEASPVPYRYGFGRLLRTDLGRQSAARTGEGNQSCLAAPFAQRTVQTRLPRADLGSQ